MRVWLENEESYTFDFVPVEIAEAVLAEILKEEKCPWQGQVTMVITGNNEIQESNRKFRGIDSPTDVLSFPAVDFLLPAGYDVIQGLEDIYLDPETKELVLGDIMISADRLRQQAKDYGHSEKREFAFLTAHSILHLLGYDHMEEEEAAIMEKKQEAVLTRLGIVRQ